MRRGPSPRRVTPRQQHQRLAKWVVTRRKDSGGTRCKASKCRGKVLPGSHRDSLGGAGECSGHRSSEPQQNCPRQRTAGRDVVDAGLEVGAEPLEVAAVLLERPACPPQRVLTLAVVRAHLAGAAAGSALERGVVRLDVAPDGGQQLPGGTVAGTGIRTRRRGPKRRWTPCPSGSWLQPVRTSSKARVIPVTEPRRDHAHRIGSREVLRRASSKMQVSMRMSALSEHGRLDNRGSCPGGSRPWTNRSAAGPAAGAPWNGEALTGRENSTHHAALGVVAQHVAELVDQDAEEVHAVPRAVPRRCQPQPAASVSSTMVRPSVLGEVAPGQVAAHDADPGQSAALTRPGPPVGASPPEHPLQGDRASRERWSPVRSRAVIRAGVVVDDGQGADPRCRGRRR